MSSNKSFMLYFPICRGLPSNWQSKRQVWTVSAKNSSMRWTNRRNLNLMRWLRNWSRVNRKTRLMQGLKSALKSSKAYTIDSLGKVSLGFSSVCRVTCSNYCRFMRVSLPSWTLTIQSLEQKWCIFWCRSLGAFRSRSRRFPTRPKWKILDSLESFANLEFSRQTRLSTAWKSALMTLSGQILTPSAISSKPVVHS